MATYVRQLKAEGLATALESLEVNGEAVIAALVSTVVNDAYVNQQALGLQFSGWLKEFAEQFSVHLRAAAALSDAARVALGLSQRFSHTDEIMVIMCDFGIGYERDAADDARRAHFVANAQDDVDKCQNRRHLRRLNDHRIIINRRFYRNCKVNSSK